MAHRHHHHERRGEGEYEEDERHRGRHHGYDREDSSYERRTETDYVGDGYVRRTETDYERDDGRGYGRRTDTYAVAPGGYGASHTVSEADVRLEGIENARRQETSYQRTEYIGEAAAALGAGFAMYERHQGKVDPENARKHLMEERIAEGLAVGGAGTAIYGHHKKEGEGSRLEELETGHKKHHFFG